jgi:hypothetical protein
MAGAMPKQDKSLEIMLNKSSTLHTENIRCA